MSLLPKHRSIAFSELGTVSREREFQPVEIFIFSSPVIESSQFEEFFTSGHMVIPKNVRVSIVDSAGQIEERIGVRSIGVFIDSAVTLNHDFIEEILRVFENTDSAIVYSDFSVRADSGTKILRLPAWSPIRFKSVDFLGPVISVELGELFSCGLDLSKSNRKQIIELATSNDLRISRIPKAIYDTHQRLQNFNVIPISRPIYSKISIIIPSMGTTENQVSILEKCIDSICRQDSVSGFEVILVLDDGYDQQVIHRITTKLENKCPLLIVEFHEDFNFSKKCNLGAQSATGDVLVFLNDDVELISPNAITALADTSLQPGIGIVGSQLRFADGSIQHAGISLLESKPKNAYLDQFPRATEFGDLNVTHEVSATTGAFVSVSSEVFKKSGGWNEDLANSYNDVDLCLRLNEMGMQTIIRNDLNVIHHESISRDAFFDEYSYAILKSLWSAEVGSERFLRAPETLGIGYLGPWGINKSNRIDLSGKYFHYFTYLIKQRGLIKALRIGLNRVSGKTSKLLAIEDMNYL